MILIDSLYKKQAEFDEKNRLSAARGIFRLVENRLKGVLKHVLFILFYFSTGERLKGEDNLAGAVNTVADK